MEIPLRRGKGWKVKRLARLTARAATVSLGLSTVFVIGVSPAQAAVYTCKTWVDRSVNEAYAKCLDGFGSYRAAATCTSPNYPYRITIYGPRHYRSTQTTNPELSRVEGDAYNCHITESWTAV